MPVLPLYERWWRVPTISAGNWWLYYYRWGLGCKQKRWWADDVAKPDWPSLLSADQAVPAIRLSLFQANDEEPDFQWKPEFISCDDFQIHKYSQFLWKLLILDTSSGYCWTYDTLKLSTWSLVSWCFDKLSGLKIVICPSVLDTYNIKSPHCTMQLSF